MLLVEDEVAHSLDQARTRLANTDASGAAFPIQTSRRGVDKTQTQIHG